MLKHFVKVFVLAAFFVVAIQASVSAYVIGIYNDTSETVYKLFAVNYSRNDWGRNLLSKPLKGHQDIEIDIPNNVHRLKIRVDFSGGRYSTYTLKSDTIRAMNIIPYNIWVRSSHN